jgi:hypothetical protein
MTVLNGKPVNGREARKRRGTDANAAPSVATSTQADSHM